ncbi:hypothetical protein Acsp05_02580 [Actinokineospora sp. NBRC 105648]|nr:hypothetical protein Acsp05_02580 [Actinokineospora sp. NBRC 105648]
MLGGVSLGVRGVHRDHHPFRVPREHTRQQRLDLCDLVRIGRDLDLGDRDAFTMDHRGEQRELIVLVSPRAAEHLAVDRDPQQPIGIPAHPFQ